MLLDNPVMLPCDELICKKCLIKEQVDGSLNCLLCSNVHNIPKDGFPISESVKKLINKIFIYEMSPEMRQIKDSIQNYKFKLKNGADSIKNVCFEARNDVQLKTEQTIELIQNWNKEMIDKINEYEEKSINTYLKDVEQFENEFKSKLDEIEDYLKSTNEDKVKLDEYTQILNDRDKDLDKLIFNQKKIQTYLHLP